MQPVQPSEQRLSNDAEYMCEDIQYLSMPYAFVSVIKFRRNRYTTMTKKLTPSHIAVAVAAGLTAQTALAQNPPPPQPTNGTGQEVTPMIKLDNNQYSGQGFFEKPGQTKKAPAKAAVASEPAASVSVAPVPAASPLLVPPVAASKGPIKDPMLPLDIVGSKDAKENTKGGLTPPLAKKESSPAPAVAGLKKPEALLNKNEKAEQTQKPTLAADKSLDKSESLVKASAPAAPVAKKKPPVVKKAVAKKPVVEAPFSTVAKEAIPVEVKELPSAAAPVAPALYAAVPTTPVIVTEVVRIDSISLHAPTSAEQETQPLPRAPEPEPVVAAIVPAPIAPPVAASVAAPAPAVVATTAPVAQEPVRGSVALPPWPQAARVDVPMASASMDDLPAVEAPSVASVRSRSRFDNRPQPTAAVASPVRPAPTIAATPTPAPTEVVAVAPSPAAVPMAVAPAAQPAPVAPAAAKPAAQEARDARIQALLDELKTLQSNPMVVESVQPPVEVVPPVHVVVPKTDPAATIQLPLPEQPRGPIKPVPKEAPRMVTEQAPKAPVDTVQTAAIDAPRTMTPAPVLEARTHRVANPKFQGLPEKGDFIAFMPGSSHVSEETVESLRSMVAVFKQHGIRKIVLTGTALRDEDSEGMESSDFAQKRAQNLKVAFQRAGFKGIVALDDPKRARPGTTPRVGLVALQ